MLWLGLVTTDNYRRMPPEGDGGIGRPASPDDDGNLRVLGLLGFCASLAVLFLATIVLYLVYRASSPGWPPAGSVILPSGLWFSTLVLALSSVTLYLAERAVRRDDRAALSAGMVFTTILGLVFLALQWLAWNEIVAINALPHDANLYIGLFFVLTGLHGLHVIGGVVPLVITTHRALSGRYSARSCRGVRCCAIYWHFLGGVWVTLLALLTLAN